MPRYGLATILGNYPVGYEFAADNLPLHLTHVDSFEIDLDAQALAARLQRLLASQKTLVVPSLADELWGPDNDIPVTTLQLTPELMALHTAVMDMLDQAGAVLKNPQYHRAGFGPHVSIYGTKRIPVGSDVVIKDLSIAAKISDAPDANRRILATISFA